MPASPRTGSTKTGCPAERTTGQASRPAEGAAARQHPDRLEAGSTRAGFPAMSDAEMRELVSDFCAAKWVVHTSEQREIAESINISREAERAIRNMSGLGRKRKTVDGRTVYNVSDFFTPAERYWAFRVGVPLVIWIGFWGCFERIAGLRVVGLDSTKRLCYAARHGPDSTRPLCRLCGVVGDPCAVVGAPGVGPLAAFGCAVRALGLAGRPWPCEGYCRAFAASASLREKV